MSAINQEKLSEVDAERKHLEGLLKDRINFYLVFATGFIIGSFSIQDELPRLIVLITGTFVSGLIWLAVFRTDRLVRMALKEIGIYNRKHPYIKYRRVVRFPPNANCLLVPVPFILTLMFFILTILQIISFQATQNDALELMQPSVTVK